MRARGADLAWLLLVVFLVTLFGLVAAGRVGLEPLLPVFVVAGALLIGLAWRESRAERIPLPSWLTAAMRSRPADAAPRERPADVAPEEPQEPQEVDDDAFRAASERFLDHIKERKRAVGSSDR
jgi:hypothetical protein